MVRIVRSDTIAARHDVVGGRHVVASLSGEPGVRYNDIRELKAHGEYRRHPLGIIAVI
jgi:hypothetical protein